MVAAIGCTDPDDDAGSQPLDLGFSDGPPFELIAEDLPVNPLRVTWSHDGEIAIIDGQKDFTPETGGALPDLIVVDAASGRLSDFATRPEVSETNPTFSPSDDRIAFAVNARGSEDWAQGPGSVWIADRDGENATQLSTEFDGGVLHTAWASSGDKVAFVVEGQPGDERLMVISADGSNETELATGTFEHLDWSPDGRQIAYSTGIKGSDVFVIDVDTGETTNLTNGDGGSFMPDWSPDGEQLTYVRHTESDGAGLWWATNIHIMQADGSNRVQLTTDYTNNWRPQWSPDGQWIGFHRGAFWNTDAKAIRPDGTDQRQLTSNLGPDSNIAWTPDSVAIRYLRAVFPEAPSETDFFTFSLASTSIDASPIRIIELDAPGSQTLWSPTNQHVVVYSASESDPDQETLVVVATDGSNVTREIEGRLGFGRWTSNRWSPDGRNLLVSRNAADGPAVVAVSIETGEETTVHGDGEAPLSVWSPDGKWVASLLWNPNDFDNRSSRLEIVPMANGQPDPTRDTRELVEGIDHDSYFGGATIEWSPDASRIAYGATIIPIAQPDETSRVEIANRQVSQTLWPPDDQRVLARSFPQDLEPSEWTAENGQWNLVDLDTGEVADTQIGGFSTAPVFAQDGTSFAYLEPIPGENDMQLVIAQPDGSVVRPTPGLPVADISGWTIDGGVALERFSAVIYPDGSARSLPFEYLNVSPDGRYLALIGESISDSSTLVIASVESLEKLDSLESHPLLSLG